MEREALLYVKSKLRISSFQNRRNFGSGEVHFYLTGTYMNDPLIGIIGALNNLRGSEIALLQVLFQPVLNPWPESMMRSVVDWQGRDFFSDSPEMVDLCKQKIERPLFAVVVRIACSADSENRVWELARGLTGALSQVARQGSNKLFPLLNDNYDDQLHLEDVYWRQSRRSGMLLNSSELVSLMHPPSISVRVPKLCRETKKTKAAPAIVIGHPFVLGENIYRDEKNVVSLSTDQRLRHMHIIGATGTGKSTLLLKLIAQDIEQGQGVGVLDPHGDLIEQILTHIPEKRFEDVILIDPADTQYPVGLNVLSAYSELDKTVLASDLVGVFRAM